MMVDIHDTCYVTFYASVSKSVLENVLKSVENDLTVLAICTYVVFLTS